ncbi:hypothetical protein DPSP01_007651 [Paraphaeosphaeria sporulosa]
MATRLQIEKGFRIIGVSVTYPVAEGATFQNTEEGGRLWLEHGPGEKFDREMTKRVKEAAGRKQAEVSTQR